MDDIDPILVIKLNAACKKARWGETHSVPDLLEQLRETFADAYLLKNEESIKRHTRMRKHCRGFSLRDYLTSRPGDTQESSSEDGPLSSSTHSLHERSYSNGDLAGVGEHLSDNFPSSALQSLRPQMAPDAFTKIEILKMHENSVWKPAMVYSSEKSKCILAFSAENISEHSWISTELVKRLATEYEELDEDPVSEIVGKIMFNAKGILYLFYQPYNCCSSLVSPFYVTDHEEAGDMLVGVDLAPRIEKLRRAAESHLETKEYYRELSTQSCPPSIRVARVSDSGLYEQVSQIRSSFFGNMHDLGGDKVSTVFANSAPHTPATQPHLPSFEVEKNFNRASDALQSPSARPSKAFTPPAMMNPGFNTRSHSLPPSPRHTQEVSLNVDGSATTSTQMLPSEPIRMSTTVARAWSIAIYNFSGLILFNLVYVFCSMLGGCDQETGAMDGFLFLFDGLKYLSAAPPKNFLPIIGQVTIFLIIIKRFIGDQNFFRQRTEQK